MQKRGTLILAAFLIALGSFLLHYTIHPPLVPVEKGISIVGADTGEQEMEIEFDHLLPSLLALFDVLVVTALFCSRRTVAYGFLFNGLLVILGTITMGHMDILNYFKLEQEVPWYLWVFQQGSLWKDVAILWGDFFVGKAIYDSYFGVAMSTRKISKETDNGG